jgi:single-strand DNA-binding protein
MASYNRVIMMGNLTRDPEHKQLSSGQAVCRFGLASNRQFKNKQTGTMVQEVCFIDVDVWGPQAESCRQYLSKGRSVLVEGRLKLDTWQENDGAKRSKHTIVADRVTFLASGAQADESQSVSGDAGSSSEPDPVGAPDFVPAASAKTEHHAKPRVKKTTKVADGEHMAGSTTGEVAFKDEAPFEDDLPF